MVRLLTNQFRDALSVLAATKMSQRALMISLCAKTHISLTTVADQSSMAFSGRIENMIIATVLFIAFVVGTGAAIVKAYEWHQDVLYGPYLKRVD
jgi:hypothetical protein